MNFPRGPRSAALVLVLAASLALAACGDDDESDNEAGSDETSVASDTATTEAATTEEAAAEGVSGELTASGIGEIQQGATTDEATAAFGEPAKKQEGPGCELAPNSDRAVAYTYQLGDGTAILVFDVKTQELGNYRVTSPSLATEKGDTVGEPFARASVELGGGSEGTASRREADGEGRAVAGHRGRRLRAPLRHPRRQGHRHLGRSRRDLRMTGMAAAGSLRRRG